MTPCITPSITARAMRSLHHEHNTSHVMDVPSPAAANAARRHCCIAKHRFARYSCGMRALFLCLLALLPLPALAEVVVIEKTTGPLSFMAGTQEYILSSLYAPPNATHTLDNWQGQSMDATTHGKDRWQRMRITAPLALTLLEQGKAQLMPLEGLPTAGQWLAEDKARSDNKGLWSQACCGVLDAGKAENGMGSWRVVQGIITGITARRDVTYINFGADWREDFTIVVPTRIAKQLDMSAWQGKLLEVRGVIEWRYGPSITLTHAAQIRLPELTTP